MSVRIAVFASGGGTNLQALLDHFGSSGRGAGAASVGLVISDRSDAGALERARGAGIAAHVIPVAGRPVAAVTADTVDALDAAGTTLIALAGYTRLIPAEVVRRYAHRILNVHPALLPSFGGRGMYGTRVHRAVLEAGCRVTGPTVHFVDEHYDEGRIVAQWPVPVLDGDSPETLARRVLAVEHALYPAAVEWLARILDEAGGTAGAGAGAAVGAEGPPGGAARSASARGAPDAWFRVEAGGGPDGSGIRRMLGLE